MTRTQTILILLLASLAGSCASNRTESTVQIGWPEVVSKDGWAPNTTGMLMGAVCIERPDGGRFIIYNVGFGETDFRTSDEIDSAVHIVTASASIHIDPEASDELKTRIHAELPKQVSNSLSQYRVRRLKDPLKLANADNGGRLKEILRSSEPSESKVILVSGDVDAGAANVELSFTRDLEGQALIADKDGAHVKFGKVGALDAQHPFVILMPIRLRGDRIIFDETPRPK